MSRIAPLRLMVMNLAGEIAPGKREYRAPERAYKLLCEWTAQDFGYDLQKWRAWIRLHPQRVKKPNAEPSPPKVTQASCNKCGTSIQLDTFQRTGGFCMPCKRLEPKAPVPKFDRNAFSVSYTIEPGWGQPKKIYQLDADAADFRIIHQRRDQEKVSGTASPWPRHKINPEIPTEERPLSRQAWAKLKKFVRELQMTALGEITGGCDSTRHYLQLRRGRTSIEYHWCSDLPKSWRSLTTIIAAMTGPFESADFDKVSPVTNKLHD